MNAHIMMNQTTENKDIFDRLMSVKCFKPLKPFYLRHKEVLLYLFFGGLTTVISIAVFGILKVSFGVNEHISNIISWILAVLFAYVTNRLWVFDAKTKNHFELVKQIIDFYGGRVLTLIFEEIIIYIFITRLNMNALVIKTLTQIIVILLNYIVSKFYVFKK